MLVTTDNGTSSCLPMSKGCLDHYQHSLGAGPSLLLLLHHLDEPGHPRKTSSRIVDQIYSLGYGNSNIEKITSKVIYGDKVEMKVENKARKDDCHYNLDSDFEYAIRKS